MDKEPTQKKLFGFKLPFFKKKLADSPSIAPDLNSKTEITSNQQSIQEKNSPLNLAKSFIKNFIASIKRGFLVKYNIGINLRNNQMCLVKAPVGKKHSKNQAECYTFVPERKGSFYTVDIQENLLKFLNQFPKEFFADAQVKLCLTYKDVEVSSSYMPKVSQRDIYKGLKTQASSDEEWNYINFGTVDKHGKKYFDISLIKAKYFTINKYLDIFKKLKIKVASITTEQFVLQEFLAAGLIPEIKTPFLMADLKAGNLKLDVIVDMKLVYSRTVPLGFDNFVMAFGGISRDEASPESTEKIEKLLASMNVFDPAIDLPAGYDKRVMMARAEFVINKMVLEVQKTESFFTKHRQEMNLTDLILMGNFSKIIGIETVFERAFQLTVSFFEYKEHVFPENFFDPKDVRYENFGWALGTSMVNPKKSANFLPKSYLGQEMLIPLFAGVLASVALAIMGVFAIAMFFVFTTMPLRKELKALNNEMNQLKQFGSKSNQRKAQGFATSKVKQIKESSLPAYQFLQFMSVLKQESSDLSKIIFDAEKVEIYGGLERDNAIPELMDFVEQVNLLPFLEEVSYEIGEESSQSNQNSRASRANQREESLALQGDVPFKIVAKINSQTMKKYAIDQNLWAALYKENFVQPENIFLDNPILKQNTEPLPARLETFQDETKPSASPPQNPDLKIPANPKRQVPSIQENLKPGQESPNMPSGPQQSPPTQPNQRPNKNLNPPPTSQMPINSVPTDDRVVLPNSESNIKSGKPVLASVVITLKQLENSLKSKSPQALPQGFHLDESVIQSLDTQIEDYDSAALTSELAGTQRIEVLQGFPDSKTLIRIKNLLKENGFKVFREDLSGKQNYEYTVLVAWKNNLVEAFLLAKILGINPRQIKVYNYPQKAVDFTVVVGEEINALKLLASQD